MRSAGIVWVLAASVALAVSVGCGGGRDHGREGVELHQVRLDDIASGQGVDFRRGGGHAVDAEVRSDGRSVDLEELGVYSGEMGVAHREPSFG